MATADDSRSSRGGAVRGAGVKRRKLDAQTSKCAWARQGAAASVARMGPESPGPRDCELHGAVASLRPHPHWHTLHRATRWTTCALSGQPLQAPVVACFLGSLYSKSAVIEWLLARAGRVEDDAAMHRYLNLLRTGGSSFDHLQSTRCGQGR